MNDADAPAAVGPRQNSGGTVFDQVRCALEPYDWFHAYWSGELSAEDYLATLSRHETHLVNDSIDIDKLHLTTRWPKLRKQAVEAWLSDLAKCGIVPHDTTDHSGYEAAAHRVESRFDHGGYRTFIFPEESHLLYAIVDILKSRRMLFLGSYYGYWAIWAAMASPSDTRLTLVDPDPRVCAVARSNAANLGLEHKFSVHVSDGETFFSANTEKYDLLVLDAEGPNSGPDPDYLRKAIYYPLMASALAHLTEDARVVTHNVLLQNQLDDPYFDWKIAQNKKELAKFLDLMDRCFLHGRVLDTSEGVSVHALPSRATLGEP